MVLRSLIKDKSKVTLDCAKATIQKDSVVEIDDKHWNSAEVQGCLKLGFAELVGEPPVAAAAAAQAVAPMRKLVCKFRGQLSLDCIKRTVTAGDVVHVPEALMWDREVQNSLNAGYLEDPSNPLPPAEMSAPAQVEDVRLSDEEAPGPAPKAAAREEHGPQTRVAAARQKAKPKAGMRAKAIRTVGDGGGEDGILDTSSESGAILDTGRSQSSAMIGGESRVHVPEDRPAVRTKKVHIEEVMPRDDAPAGAYEISASEPVRTESDVIAEQMPGAAKTKNVFGFLDVFEKGKKG